MNQKLILLGRILFGLPLLLYSIVHFQGGSNLAALYVPSYLPGGVFWIYLSGIIYAWASVAIILGKGIRTASLVFGVMMLLLVAFVYWPILSKNPSLVEILRDNLFKGISLAGAAFYFAGTASSKHSGGSHEDK